MNVLSKSKHNRSLRGVLRSKITEYTLWASDLFDRQAQFQNESSTKLKFAGAMEDLPKQVYLWNNDVDCLLGGNRVKDQGDTNKCVAFSLCTIGEWQLTQEMKQQQIELEPDCIYLHRSNPYEEGMTADDGFGIIIVYGFVDTLEFSNILDLERKIEEARIHRNRDLFNQLVSELRKHAYILAHKASPSDAHKQWIASSGESHPVIRRIITPYSCISGNAASTTVNTTNDDSSNSDSNDYNMVVKMNDSPHVYAQARSVLDIKRALAYGNGPLNIIVPCENADHPQGMIWRKEYLSDLNTSSGGLGHAMTIIGYDDAKQAVLIRNSWNDDWGPMQNGHVWMPYADINKGLFWEIWVLFIDGKLHLKYIHERDAKWAHESGCMNPHIPRPLPVCDGKNECDIINENQLMMTSQKGEEEIDWSVSFSWWSWVKHTCVRICFN